MLHTFPEPLAMFLRHCALPLLTSLALCAATQESAAQQVGTADCNARMAAIEQDMATARSKGQMLRRQRLENDLVALRAQCLQATAEPSREARIAQLEEEIRALQAQLGRAEEQLRRLKADAL